MKRQTFISFIYAVVLFAGAFNFHPSNAMSDPTAQNQCCILGDFRLLPVKVSDGAFPTHISSMGGKYAAICSDGTLFFGLCNDPKAAVKQVINVVGNALSGSGVSSLQFTAVDELTVIHNDGRVLLMYDIPEFACENQMARFKSHSAKEFFSDKRVTSSFVCPITGKFEIGAKADDANYLYSYDVHKVRALSTDPQKILTFCANSPTNLLACITRIR